MSTLQYNTYSPFHANNLFFAFHENHLFIYPCLQIRFLGQLWGPQTITFMLYAYRQMAQESLSQKESGTLLGAINVPLFIFASAFSRTLPSLGPFGWSFWCLSTFCINFGSSTSGGSKSISRSEAFIVTYSSSVISSYGICAKAPVSILGKKEIPFSWYWNTSSACFNWGPSVSGSNVTVQDTWLSAQCRCRNAAMESCSHMEMPLVEVLQVKAIWILVKYLFKK